MYLLLVRGCICLFMELVVVFGVDDANEIFGRGLNRGRERSL